MDLTQNMVPTTEQAPRVARLTRHLKARLEDFGPGGPEVVRADQETGTVCFRVPGKDSDWLRQQLGERWDIRIQVEDGLAVCRLRADIPFEQLDRLWGCLFELVG